MGIRLLDCTLRDGGHLNDSMFGEGTIKGIVSGLELSKVDIIEVGFVRDMDFGIDYAAVNNIEEFETRLALDSPNVEYSVMIQQDQYDVQRLPMCTGKIKRIRVSFHDYDMEEGISFCEEVIKKGYVCHVNPINIVGYSDEEILRLVETVNRIKAHVFTLVDTFGSMTKEDLLRIFMLVQHNLNPDKAIGVHFHDNLRMAFALGQTVAEIAPQNRQIIVDCSLLGMGRAPGNLCLELMMEYLNNMMGANYNVNEALDLIDEYIYILQENYPWGYLTAYSLSAQYKLHRTYAEYLLKKQKLKSKEIKQILGMIEKSKRSRYDEKYIEELYESFIGIEVDDSKLRDELRQLIGNEKVFLVAPGNSLNLYKDEILEFVRINKPYIISANFKCDYLDEELIFCSNVKRYDKLIELASEDKIILASHVKNMVYSNCNVINTNNLAWFGDVFWDNNMLMLINLLRNINIKDCYVAGWDGFTKGQNFINNDMESIYDYEEENQRVISIIKNYFSDININFITPSRYQ